MQPKQFKRKTNKPQQIQPTLKPEQAKPTTQKPHCENQTILSLLAPPETLTMMQMFLP